MKNSSQILKSLQTRKSSLTSEMSLIDKQINGLQEQKRVLNKQLTRINSDIKGLSDKGKEIVISEHAILQYLERVKEMNIESIKREMIPDKAKKIINTVASAKVPVDGYTLVVENKTIVTVKK